MIYKGVFYIYKNFALLPAAAHTYLTPLVSFL